MIYGGFPQVAHFYVCKNIDSFFEEWEGLSNRKLSQIYVCRIKLMESIELLFGAWFIGQNDIACARDAIKLYEFVCKNREKIVKNIYC